MLFQKAGSGLIVIRDLGSPLIFTDSSSYSNHWKVVFYFWTHLFIFLFPSVSEEKGGLVSEAYGEDDFSRLGGDEDGYEEEEDENSKQSVSKSVPKSTVVQSTISFVRNLLNCANSVPFHGQRHFRLFPPLFVWYQLRKLDWISIVLFENEIYFHLHHLVLTSELKLGAGDGGRIPNYFI